MFCFVFYYQRVKGQDFFIFFMNFWWKNKYIESIPQSTAKMDTSQKAKAAFLLLISIINA